jgi:antitoxin component YwqK of YwqJK toxin-antitoxin module
MTIGYIRYTYYIIEIEDLDKPNDSEIDINKKFAQQYTSKFIVKSITNWKTNNQIENIENIDIIEKIDLFGDLENFKIGQIYYSDTKHHYSLDKELAIFHYSFSADDEEEYLKNKSGIFKKYGYVGKLSKEYFHNNGIKEGVYKEYNINENIRVECNFINNKKNGVYKMYSNDGKIIKEYLYCEDKVIEIINNYFII